LKYLLLLPSIILFLIFTIWPIAEVVKLSVYKTNFITETFVGLDNYIAIFQDNDFLLSILNSLTYAIILIPGQIILSLAMALFVYNMKKHWVDVSRMVFYIPVLSAGIIIAQAWQWILENEHIDIKKKRIFKSFINGAYGLETILIGQIQGSKEMKKDEKQKLISYAKFPKEEE